jgi:hypothetical protein
LTFTMKFFSSFFQALNLAFVWQSASFRCRIPPYLGDITTRRAANLMDICRHSASVRRIQCKSLRSTSVRARMDNASRRDVRMFIDSVHRADAVPAVGLSQGQTVQFSPTQVSGQSEIERQKH